MRSEEEIKEMISYAHERQQSEFWRGVKHALFWGLGAIGEIKEEEVMNEMLENMLEELDKEVRRRLRERYKGNPIWEDMKKKKEKNTLEYYWMWYKFVRYEYKCPHCGHVNVRYERCARIVCSKCGKSFTV